MTTPPELQAIAERQLCGLVNGLAQRISEHVRERAAALGLTASQATALREMSGPMTMRELAERMSCEPSNTTFVVDKLEKQSLIERHPHPTDRRAKQLVLTAGGSRCASASSRCSPWTRRCPASPRRNRASCGGCWSGPPRGRNPTAGQRPGAVTG